MSAEAGPSTERKDKKPKHMVDGREETKEERKARKAAKRESKANALDQNAQGDDSLPAPLQADSAVANNDTGTPETGNKKSKDKKDKKDQKDKKDKKDKEDKKDELGESTIPAEEAQPGSSASGEKTKKDKKRKRDATTADGKAASSEGKDGEDAAIAGLEGEMSKKQKRRLAREALAATRPEPPKREVRADLENDASLTEPAKKALEYAHQFVDSQAASGEKKWKFNKANQNWLIRNVWDDAEIPDKHLDVTLAYLRTVQGGARQNLVSVAEKHVNPSIAEESAVSEESSKADATTDEAAPAAKAETAPAQSEEDRAEAERKASMLRSRGEKLLAAFK